MRDVTLAVGFVIAAAAAAAAAQAPAPAPQPAAPTSDESAISLADEAPTEKTGSQSWQAFVEGTVSRSRWRNPDDKNTEGRASFDLRFDSALAPGLRAVLSDRLDLVRRNNAVVPRKNDVNTLREAYLSWHARPDAIVDVGRINLRYGAAFGYNPTDFFKAGALRTIVSIDPPTLRENRQGTVVVQGQKLWSDSSLSAAYSPRLGDSPSDKTFSLDFGATNPHNRWLLAGSHKFAAQFNPQLILYGGSSTPTQAGLNVSGLINRATVAYLEVSAGKGRRLVAKALDAPDSSRTRTRTAAGFTYTTDFNLLLTAEYERNSAAPDRRQWREFIAAAPFNALRLLQAAQIDQDLPTRQALFVYALWRDVALRNLDLSGFVRWDVETHSREQWIETRYHWSKVEAALRWQQYSGSARSVFGAVPQARRLELLLRFFL